MNKARNPTADPVPCGRWTLRDKAARRRSFHSLGRLMTIPTEYAHASIGFEKFMVDARDISGLNTTNMAYNMVVGVLYAFRRRLTVKDALRFANGLPAIIRAIFVSNWDTEQPQLEFTDRESMTKEVQSLRKEHNFSPDSAIHDIALALRRNVDQQEFDRILSFLPAGAREFWKV